MMSFSYIIEFVKVLYRERRAPERLSDLAAFCWWSMLVISVALFLATAAAGGYELNKTLEPLNASSKTVESKSNPALDRPALEALNASFEQRAGLFTAVQRHLPTFINPSD